MSTICWKFKEEGTIMPCELWIVKKEDGDFQDYINNSCDHFPYVKKQNQEFQDAV